MWRIFGAQNKNSIEAETNSEKPRQVASVGNQDAVSLSDHLFKKKKRGNWI